jgi:hypothetical protein
MPTDIEPDDARTLEFEANRDTAAGAKLRLTLSHWLQFDEVPHQLAADENASRTHIVVVLPRLNTSDIEQPGARFECREFVTLRDLRAFHSWLHATFSSFYEHYTTDDTDAEFVLAGSNRSLELRFRSEIVRKKRKISIVGRISDLPLQRDEWSAHWKWATESAGDFKFAFASNFAFFFDPECLRLAARQLGVYLRVYGPIEE